MLDEMLFQFVLELVAACVQATLDADRPEPTRQQAVRANPDPAASASFDLWDDEIDGPWALRQR
jgi:hypothetical protein